MRQIASIVLGIAALAPCGLTTGCSPAADPNTDALMLGAYSVVKEAFHDGLLPAFAAEWTRQTGRAVLSRIQANVINMDPSGRQSVANFERGTGDALVTYENELLLRRKAGQEIPYVVPSATLLIESPAALVESSVARHGNREVAR